MPHVTVIGGGITGTSVARDLAMRGCDITLLDQGSLATGTTGHSHGLLHSGARYADQDPDVARECIAENRTLKRIAPHCIRDTGGCFVATPGDPDGYPATKREACRDAGIPVQDDPALPDAVADDITDAFRVPDATVHPAALTAATALSARSYGATIRTGTAATGIETDGGRVTGVTATQGSGTTTIATDHVVNAAGPWAGRVAALADEQVPLALSAGTMATVALPLPVTVNRCRPPATGDIAVAHGDAAVLGTTSTPVDDPDAPAPGADVEEAVATLRRELAPVLPAARDTALIDTYRGIRPLYAPADAAGDRSTSRHHAVIRHGDGFTSIIGGKLTTARLMAEDTADAVCDALDITAACATADEPLPGHDDPSILADAAATLAADSPAEPGR